MGLIIKNGLEAYQRDIDKEISDQKLRKIVETAPDGILIINDEHRITMLNSAVLRLFYYKRKEDLIGQKLDILISKSISDLSNYLKQFDETLSHSRNTKPSIEVYGRTSSGEMIPVEIAISKMELDGKRFYNAIIRDVSQRLINEQKIKKSERKFREIFNSLTDMYAQSDLQGRCTLISPSVDQILGYKPDELINYKLSGLYKKTHNHQNL